MSAEYESGGHMVSVNVHEVVRYLSDEYALGGQISYVLVS